MLAIVALALLVADCARRGARVEDPRRAPAPSATAASPGAATAATLVPPDLALAFLQGINSDPGNSPCKFTDKGTWSAGEFRKVTGLRAQTQITGYPQWILLRIEDPGGRDFSPADLSGSGSWVYTLRTPRTARTPLGTNDQCVVGPTNEPARKVLEALAALGVAVAPEFNYILAR